jgi:seryl-tRNA synthetase
VLDLKQIRENPDRVQAKLNQRHGNYEIEPIVSLDRQRREIEVERSALQARSNEIGKQVGQKMNRVANRTIPYCKPSRTKATRLRPSWESWSRRRKRFGCRSMPYC